VVRPSGLATDASIHTLRHTYAAHLLERGISWRVIQDLLGHKSPSTTARSTHLTDKTFDVVPATIIALMADLSPRRSMGMPEMADVLQLYGRDYLQRFGQNLLPSHRRAMDDILRCRTAVGVAPPPVRSFPRNHLWTTTVSPLYRFQLRASSLASIPLPCSPSAGPSFRAPAKTLPNRARLY
jgi:Phage integrase family